MIKVDITRRDELIKVTVTGHAGYAEHGADIVCSAVSILVYTMLESLEKDRYILSKLEHGNVDLVTYGKKALEIVGMFEKGFRILQREYPENVYVNSAL